MYNLSKFLPISVFLDVEVKSDFRSETLNRNSFIYLSIYLLFSLFIQEL